MDNFMLFIYICRLTYPISFCTGLSDPEKSDPFFEYKTILWLIKSKHSSTSGFRDPIMYCSLCKTSFNSMFDWMDHKELHVHQVDNDIEHECKICQIILYCRKVDLKLHIELPEHKHIDSLFSK